MKKFCPTLVWWASDESFWKRFWYLPFGEKGRTIYHAAFKVKLQTSGKSLIRNFIVWAGLFPAKVHFSYEITCVRSFAIFSSATKLLLQATKSSTPIAQKKFKTVPCNSHFLRRRLLTCGREGRFVDFPHFPANDSREEGKVIQLLFLILLGGNRRADVGATNYL